MRILYSKLIDLPVKTKSGEFLGKVCDLEIDVNTYGIVKLYVRSNNLIRGLFEDVLIISQSQILEITDEKIVIENGARKIKSKKRFNIKIEEKRTATATAAERK